MQLACPTRHRLHARPWHAGVRHVAARRHDALAGSYDPVWTAQAEGRFIGGVLRGSGGHPLLVAGRVLVLVALLCSILAPLAQVLRPAGTGLLAAATGALVYALGAALGLRRRT